MTITSYPAQRGREVHERAEFDPQALAEPTPPSPSIGQPAPDTRPSIAAVGVGVDGAVTPYALSPRPAARARTLSVLTGVPERGRAGLEVLRLDRDLDLWFDIDGAERHPRNPVASVIAAAFGVHDGIWGPVVFTAAQDEHGITASISAAACVLIAGTAAASDGPRPSPARQSQRGREFAALGVEAIDPDRSDVGPVALPTPREPDDAPTGDTDPTAPVEWFDALANTVTRDGEMPCCAECGEPTTGGHDDHQPEALGAPDPER